VDDESPPPSPTSPPPAKRHRPATIHDFDGHKPPKGSHRRRALKRKEKITEQGRVPRAAVARDYIQTAEPIPTRFDASTLPTAHGAYAGKVEGKTEKYGSKKPRSLTELIAMGFQLVKWNG
jgi:hypothetical protein